MDFGVENLQRFAQDLRGQLYDNPPPSCDADDSDLNSELCGPSLSNIAITLRKALTDFRWSWVSPTGNGVHPSPRRAGRTLHSSVPIKPRNYLYLISSAPASAKELEAFVGASTDRGTSSERSRVDHDLWTVCEQLLGGGLWKGFIDSRVALTWLGVPSSTYTAGDSISIPSDTGQQDHLIETGLSNILAAYGGIMIPAEQLAHGPTCIPAATLFHRLGPKTLDPRIGLDVLAGMENKSPVSFTDSERFLGGCQKLWKGTLSLGSTNKGLPAMATVGAKAKIESQAFEVSVLAINTKPGIMKRHSSKRSLLSNVDTPVTQQNPDGPTFSVTASELAEIGCMHSTLIEPTFLERHVFLFAASIPDSPGLFRYLTLLQAEGNVCMLEVYLDVIVPTVAEPANTGSSPPDGESLPSLTESPTQEDNPFMDTSPIAGSVQSEKRLAVLIPSAGSAYLRIVERHHEIRIRTNLGNTRAANQKGLGRSNSQEVESWFAATLDPEIKSVLFHGAPLAGLALKLTSATIGIWTPECDGRRADRDPSTHPTTPALQRFTSPLPLSRTPKKTKLPTPRYQCVEDLGTAIREKYIATLYGNTTIVLFLESMVPLLWSALDSVVVKRDGAPSPGKRKFTHARTVMTEAFLESIKRSILLPVKQLEHKYRSLPDLLDQPSLTDTEEPGKLPLLDSVEEAALENWRDRLCSSSTSDASARRSVLRRELTKIRLEEAKLQLVILLECLRVHRDMSATLPDIAAWFARPAPPVDATTAAPGKRKRGGRGGLDDISVKRPTKRRATTDSAPSKTLDPAPPENDSSTAENPAACENHYIRACGELMDRLCIWNAIDAQNGSLLKTFVEPILVK
ncbi:hypothetical protein HKX48_001985 [Thoreauomyces humboldtii]|nr:hypothetical protein HKX48_001985 [Thoreauomyces humboldtii]